MKMGQLLVHRGAIDRFQLREALRRQGESGEPLGQILLEMGIVSRADLIAAVMTLPGGRAEAETLAGVNPEVTALIPRELRQRHRCTPLMAGVEHLVVAMVDPFDRAAIAALEQATGRVLVPIAADLPVLRQALEDGQEEQVAYRSDDPGHGRPSPSAEPSP